MSKLVKKPHQCFDAFLRERENAPFAWGSNDCALFSADAIHANTGTDIAADFRGKYTTELGALRAIQEVAGGTTIVDAVAYCANKHAMTEHIHPLMAKRGDLVIVANAGALICGVVHLNGIHIVSVSETGTVRLPLADAKGKPNVVRAWSV
jgi:hypothetical protein